MCWLLAGHMARCTLMPRTKLTDDQELLNGAGRPGLLPHGKGKFGREVVLVWPGGTCNYVSDLRPTRVETRAPKRGAGTAFVLVKEEDQRSIDGVFGPVDRKAA